MGDAHFFFVRFVRPPLAHSFSTVARRDDKLILMHMTCSFLVRSLFFFFFFHSAIKFIQSDPFIFHTLLLNIRPTLLVCHDMNSCCLNSLLVCVFFFFLFLPSSL